jgi:hypothetical protein
VIRVQLVPLTRDYTVAAVKKGSRLGGFTVVEAIIGLGIACIILAVSWQLWSGKPVTHPLGGAAGIHAATTPAGDMSNTYSYDKFLFPEAPSTDGVIYRAPAAPEIDYITADSASLVHSEVVRICSAHKFRFNTAAETASMTECDGHGLEWKFTVEPASDLINQSWYPTISQIDEAALAKSTWLQITSGPYITD